MSVPALRFREFSDSWIETKIGEIASKVRSGSTPRGGEEVYQSSGIQFIRSQNVNNEQLLLDDVTYISDEINTQMKGSIVKPNDILLNITGASIGRSCVVPSNFLIGNVNQHVCIIRLKADYIPRFLQPYLSSSRGQKSISSTQVGSGREGLNFEAIRSFKVSVPAPLEQTKIASFLTSIDEKITHLTQKHDLLTQYKKGVMQQIFSQALRFKDDDGGDFPEWEFNEIGKFLVKHDEKSTENNQYPVLTSSRRGIFLQKDYFNGVDVASKDNTGYNVVPKNFFTYRHMSDDLIFAFNRNTIVDRGIVSTLYPVFTTRNIDNDFLQIVLNNGNEFKEFAIQQKQGGSRTYMYFTKLEKLEINLPCVAEQTKIANFFTAIDDKITATQTQLQAVKQYKQGLLQQMFV